MSFHFAFLCNDAALSATAQAAFRADLTIETGAPNGWGLGYYHAGQPLLRKHPQEPAEAPLDFCNRLETIRTNLALGHVRGTATGGRSNENTQPFRFRNWTFCHLGPVPGFDQLRDEVAAAIPGFIRRNIRGTTDSELLFHLFLAFLNDAGRLDDRSAEAAAVAGSLRSALTYIDRMLAAQQQPSSAISCMASNGRLLVAIGRGIPMAISRNSSYLDLGRGEGDRPLSYPHLRAVALVAGREPQSPGWESVGNDAVVAVDQDLDIQNFGQPG